MIPFPLRIMLIVGLIVVLAGVAFWATRADADKPRRGNNPVPLAGSENSKRK